MNKYTFEKPDGGWDTPQFCKGGELALLQYNAIGMEFYRVDEVDSMLHDADKAFDENGELRQRIAFLESTRASDELLESILIRLNQALAHVFETKAYDEVIAILAKRKEQDNV